MQIVEEALNKARAGRTSIIISHRLSSIIGANIIVYIDHGKVLEKGTHGELMALKKHYYQLQLANQGGHKWTVLSLCDWRYWCEGELRISKSEGYWVDSDYLRNCALSRMRCMIFMWTQIQKGDARRRSIVYFKRREIARFFVWITKISCFLFMSWRI